MKGQWRWNEGQGLSRVRNRAKRLSDKRPWVIPIFSTPKHWHWLVNASSYGLIGEPVISDLCKILQFSNQGSFVPSCAIIQRMNMKDETRMRRTERGKEEDMPPEGRDHHHARPQISDLRRERIHVTITSTRIPLYSPNSRATNLPASMASPSLTISTARANLLYHSFPNTCIRPGPCLLHRIGFITFSGLGLLGQP